MTYQVYDIMRRAVDSPSSKWSDSSYFSIEDAINSNIRMEEQNFTIDYKTPGCIERFIRCGKKKLISIDYDKETLTSGPFPYVLSKSLTKSLNSLKTTCIYAFPGRPHTYTYRRAASCPLVLYYEKGKTKCVSVFYLYDRSKDTIIRAPRHHKGIIISQFSNLKDPKQMEHSYQFSITEEDMSM
jgi:hypothetical protein